MTSPLSIGFSTMCTARAPYLATSGPPPGGEVACRRHRHPDHAALGRRVGDLADLAVVGGDRGGVDDHAALPAFVGLVASMAAAARRSTLDVPTRLTPITRSNGSSVCGPRLPAAFSAQPSPAQ